MTKARDLADFVSAGNPLADGTIDVADISDLTATAAEINILDGVTATTTEINYLDGVTSNIQSQFDGLITDLVSDTTPQLGGDLDLNSSDITGTGNVNITGTVTATSFSGDGSALTGIQAGAGYFQGENGATGDTTNGKGDIFRVHEPTLNTSTTIASGDNALAAGPLTVASGVTLTVSGNLSIV